MPKAINQYNFFKDIKLTEEGYVEMYLTDYVAPKEDGIDQYETYLKINLDDEGRIIVTEKE